MKRRSEKLAVFTLGVLAAFTVSALAEPALAAGQELLYDRVGVSLFGEEYYAAGDPFTGENGETLPASITYVDEKGGATNYLPLRLIAELLDTRIVWNGETNTVELDPPVSDRVSISVGDEAATEYAAAPAYGVTSGAFEEIDPATVERGDGDSTFYIYGARIQTERCGMPEYTQSFSILHGNCILFTVTNNGELPQVVRVMRSTSPLSGTSRDSFTRVLLEPGQTLERAFRVSGDANPMQYELLFDVIAPTGGRYPTDVTVSIEQFAMK